MAVLAVWMAGIMTRAQLDDLTPFFSDTETYLSGKVVDWNPIAFETMRLLYEVRKRLGQPIKLIRGAHPNRVEAVDWCCPSLPYGAVVMEALRMPCAVGIYSGRSLHADTRPMPDGLCARWLAVRDRELPLLGKIKGLEASRANGWVYLRWSDADGLSFDALQLVVDLAEPRSESVLTV